MLFGVFSFVCAFVGPRGARPRGGGGPQVLLRDGKRWGLHSRMESLAFLGSTFRTVLQAPATATDVDLGKKVIDR